MAIERKMDVLPLYSNLTHLAGLKRTLYLPHARSVTTISPLANGVIISHEYDRLMQISRINSESFLGASLGEKSDYREARRKSENRIGTAR
ncbi:hypothetical protein N7516_005253 [Penicillium verrucosum]|uniref:uncharacterized protein n=1 Tax=Penicillium verrucosum TaxID=60171 RepID=UPI0025452F65|nr:uncharacterized protein N7516_005253 [Penicillium verrucosum]KAJ5945085.1 hypothetical protein N7516_005253 [Penicillium verrucosum]